MTESAQSPEQLQLRLSPVSPRLDYTPLLRVVIPCSKRKVASREFATRDELDDRRVEVEARLAGAARAARDIYTGRAYRRAVTALDEFEEKRPDLTVALHIASAGYGLVAGDDRLVPYEATMGASRREWVTRGHMLGMPDRAREVVESCDLTVFALSDPYLYGAALAGLEAASGFAAIISASRVAHSPGRRWFRAGRREARALSVAEREVGTVILDRLLGCVASAGLSTVRDLPEDPLEWPCQ